MIVCFSGLNSIPVNQLSVILGEYNLREPEVPESIVENVKNAIVHPKHKCGQYIDDIAILELVMPIIWTDSVQPGCLPQGQDDLNYQKFNGKVAIAAGWGWLGEDRTKCEKRILLEIYLQKKKIRILYN